LLAITACVAIGEQDQRSPAAPVGNLRNSAPMVLPRLAEKRLFMMRAVIGLAILAAFFPAVALANGAQFRTPSGNIRCLATARQVNCLVLSTGGLHRPPFPKQWFLSPHGRVVVGRPSDTNICLSSCYSRVVPYGWHFRYGYKRGGKLVAAIFSCASRFSGLTCQSVLSGHGFFLSRERQRTW
jgi:hypothetical protein